MLHFTVERAGAYRVETVDLSNKMLALYMNLCDLFLFL